MELEQLLNKIKANIINIGVVFFALIVCFNIYKKQGEQLNLIIASKEQELKKNEVLERIGRLEKELNPYQKLFRYKGASEVISNISATANAAGAKITTMRPMNEEQDGESIRYPFSLTVNCEDNDMLGRFLSRLENQEEYYLVESINITPKRGGGELVADLKVSPVEIRK